MNFFKELSESFSKGFNSEKNHGNQIEDKENKLEEEKDQEKENEDVKDIDIEKKDKLNFTLKVKREEKNREIKFQKTLEYFNLPSDTTKEELQQVIEKNKGKKLQDKKKREKVKNAIVEPENSKKEIFPIDGITELTDEELKEKFDELIKPFNLILDELIIKQKEWMPNKEKDAYSDLVFEISNHYFFPIKLNTLEWFLEKFDDLVLEDYLDQLPILKSTPLDKYFDKSTGFENIDKSRLAFKTAHIEFFKIIWSFFGIQEDLLKVYKLFEKFELNDGSHNGNKEQREWESCQKTYFYHDKKQIKRILNLCLDLDIFKTEENYESSEGIETEDLDIETSSGFVYFIRNQDIYKIGITQNMIQRMAQLTPDELLDSRRCSNYRELEREIHKEFKDCRIPQTEYFRLNKKQINQIHKMLSEKAIS